MHSIFKNCLQLLFRLYKMSPVSKHKVDEPRLFQRTSLPFSKKFQDLVDKYPVSTSKIVHDNLEVYILGTDVKYVL